MKKTYYINPELLNAYVKREMKTKSQLVFGIMGAFALLFLILLQFNLNSFCFAALFMLLAFVLQLSAENGTRNLAKSLQITFTDDAVVKIHAKDQVDGLTQVGMELNSMRYGTKFNLVIPYKKINYTEISEYQITIVKDGFSFDDNNKIKIPKETIDYEEVLHYIQENSKKFNVIQE